MEYQDNIIITAIGTLTTGIAYIIGSRSKAKAKQVDSVTDGANKVVESSMRILALLETNLTEERAHRAKCESEVLELRREISDIRKEFSSQGHKTR